MVGSKGIVTSKKADASFAADLVEAMGWHRHWARKPTEYYNGGQPRLSDRAFRA
jgi:hypothetical protein